MGRALMQLGIFAKTFPGENPDQILNSVAAAGFSTTQYNMACSGLAAMPDLVSPEILAAIKTASLKTGVSIAAVSGTYNMIHPDAGVKKLGHKRLEILAASCAAMGTNLITLCTGSRNASDQWASHPDNNSQEAWHDLTHSFETAIQIADRHNIHLGIEPELANVVNSATKAKQLIDDMQSPRLKIVFDAANLFETEGLDEQRNIITSAINVLGEHIIMAHAKDRLPNGEFATAGTGCLDYLHYIKALKSIGFEGPLITHGLKAIEAASTAAFLKRCAENIN
jgi:sugar phosphate isomerase/epimerase